MISPAQRACHALGACSLAASPLLRIQPASAFLFCPPVPASEALPQNSPNSQPPDTPDYQPTLNPLITFPRCTAHLMSHKEDAVYMIRHNLKGKHTHLWIMLRNLSPTTLDLTPQLCWLYVGGCYSCSPSHKPTQQWLPSFRTERYHIDTPPLIVIPFKPP